jgi:hypothetical protein
LRAGIIERQEEQEIIALYKFISYSQDHSIQYVLFPRLK